MGDTTAATSSAFFVQSAFFASKVLPADRSRSPLSTGPLFFLVAWVLEE